MDRGPLTAHMCCDIPPWQCHFHFTTPAQWPLPGQPWHKLAISATRPLTHGSLWLWSHLRHGTTAGSCSVAAIGQWESPPHSDVLPGRLIPGRSSFLELKRLPCLRLISLWPRFIIYSVCVTILLLDTLHLHLNPVSNILYICHLADTSIQTDMSVYI